jgi:RluA family pseudouridine synthase
VNDSIKLSSPATGEFWEIPVLFEDEHLLAISKPACLLTSPDRYDPNRPNLMKLLHAGIATHKPWATLRRLSYLANGHRLDFETTGVLLLAKTKPVLVHLANLFGSEKPVKTYVALLPGTPPHPEWEVDAPLAPFPGRPGQMRVDPRNGKKSRTAFVVREQFRGYTLVQCRPYTGRTHQIRVHLKHWGLPICGDRVYGGRPLLLSELKTDYRLKPGRTERPLISTVALHAEDLSLSHPVTGREVRITAPWPKDLTVAVKNLRRYAPA